jgi:hypothetical protein
VVIREISSHQNNSSMTCAVSKGQIVPTLPKLLLTENKIAGKSLKVSTNETVLYL